MEDPGLQNISNAVARAAKLQPEIRLARCISEFSNVLSGDRQTHTRFKNLQTRTPPSAVEVVQLTEEINRDGARRHKSWRPHGTRLIMVLERVRQFAPVGDILIGGSQNMLASGVWAAVRMSLEISLGYLSYFDKVSTMLLKIGRSLSLNQDFAILFPRCRKTQEYMCEYTIVFVEMCKTIVVHARRSIPSQVAASFLSTFDSAFRPFENDLAEWGQLIEKQTMILLAKSTNQDRSSNMERFNRLQITLLRSFSKRDVQVRKHRLLKHLCPDQKEFDATWRRERRRGTSNWILGTQPYQSWRSQSASATFWLKGNLGSGKTVTMASIVADLLMAENETGVERTSQEDSQPGKLRTVSYFFCRNGSSKTLQADNILGSLAFQALNHRALAQRLERFLETSEGIRDNKALDFCIDLLLKITPSNWHGVFVLDGLDEAPPEEIKDLFLRLEKLRSERKVSLCCSSRPNSACESVVGTALGIDHTLSLEQVDRSDDIRSYIQSQIERWNTIRRLPAELENLIVEQLLVGSQGMFLWLSLQVEAICPSYTGELQSEAGIFNLLGNLPRNLPEAFDQTLLRVPNHQHTSRILKIVAAAEPPMLLDELRVAVNIEPGNLTWSPLTLISSGSTLLSKHGGSLLDIDEEDLCVRFIHHSVILHLSQPPALPTAAPFHFDFGESEHILGEICVTYLNYDVLERQVSTTHRIPLGKVPEAVINSLSHQNSVSRKIMSLISRDRGNATSEINIERLASKLQIHNTGSRDDVRLFLPYATENWLRFTKTFSESMSGNLYRLWSNLIDGNVQSILESLPWPAQSLADAAEWAICNGHGLLFRHRLRLREKKTILEILETTLRLAEGSMDVEFNLAGDQLGLLLPVFLIQAREHASPENLDILVRLGCQPFGTGNSFESHPITAFSRPILDSIARSVIPGIFDDKSQRTRRTCIDTAMVIARYLSHIDTLFQNGKTLLHLVIENKGEDEAESLLRDFGADPNGGCAPDVPSPLQLSLERNLSTLIPLTPLSILLIELGADVLSSPDGSFPPLFVAIRWGDIQMFDIMRETQRAAPSDRYGPDQETALQYACRKFCEGTNVPIGNPLYIVKTLLSDGADVNVKNRAGESPIMIAFQNGSLGLMKCLQAHGANHHGTDALGATLLHYTHGHELGDLLAEGADANAASVEGVTPLMVATFHADVRGVVSLIQAGADVNIRLRTKGRGKISAKGAEIFSKSRKNLKRDPNEDLVQGSTLNEIGNGHSAAHIALSELRFQTLEMTKKYKPWYHSKDRYHEGVGLRWKKTCEIVDALVDKGMSEDILQELQQSTREHIRAYLKQSLHSDVPWYKELETVKHELWFWAPVEAKIRRIN